MKETLEEAAEKYAKYNQYDLEYCDEGGCQGIDVKSFTEKLVDFTTKWQQKRSYSEEEMKSSFKVGFSIGYGSDVHDIDEKNRICEEWFEQFRKK